MNSLGISIRSTFAPLAAALLLASFAPAASAHDHHAPPPESMAARDDEQERATIAFHEERLASRPNDRASLLGLGEALTARGRRTGDHADFVRARDLFGRILADAPDNQTALFGRANAALAGHRFREGLADAERLAKLKPCPLTWALLGDCHYALGEVDAAAELFAAIEEEEGLTLPTLVRQAQVAEARGQFDAADALYADAVVVGRMVDERDPAIAWVGTLRGDLALRRGRWSDARDFFVHAAEEDPGLHYAYWRLARLDIAQGRPEAAERAARRLLEVAPKTAYRLTLASALEQMERGEEANAQRAAALAEYAEQYGRGDLGHIREYARALLARPGGEALALELARRDFDEVRRDWEGREVLLLATIRAGRDAEALQIALEGLRAGVEQPGFLWLAASALRRAGRTAEADDAKARAARLNPLVGDRYLAAF